MRTVTGPETTVLQGAHYATHARVSVEDSGGTWRDLSTLGGIDHNHSGRIRKTVDQIVPTLNLQVWRHQQGGESLAPLMASSAYAGYVRAGGGIRVDFATVANSATPGASDWKRVLEGVVDEWGVEGDFLAIQARDSIGALIGDRWVKEEMELGSDAGDTLDSVMQQILDKWADGLQLYVPTAPSFVVTPYRQQKMSVLNALLQLAALIGWVIEPRWDDGTSTFRLTLYEPDRTPASTSWTWAANRYAEVPTFKLSRLNVRNDGSIWFTDAATGARTQYTVQDNNSILAYDQQFIEFEEGDNSPIDSASEAQAMLDAAILDLKDPVAEAQWRTFCFWPIQLGDYYTFSANGEHFDSDQDFGITGFTHEWKSNGHVDTLMDTRGKPAGFTQPWLVRGGQSRTAIDTFDGLRLYDVKQRIDYPTEGDITFEWTPGSDVAEVWPYLYTHDLPILATDKLKPADGDSPVEVDYDGTTATLAPIARGTDSITVTAPDAGYQRFLTLEPRDATGKAGQPFRIQIDPKTIATGADLPANGDIVYGALAKSFQKYGYTGAFTNSGAASVSWAGGTLTLTDGSGPYTISGGSVTGLGGPIAPSYIYFDPTISTTTFQKTSTWSSAFGDSKLLIATAWAGDVLANHVLSIGILSLDGSAINPLSITTGHIAALSITAGKLSVASLSAISANIGTVTAGLIQDSTGNFFIDLDATGTDAWLHGTSAFLIRADGYVGMSNGDTMWWGGVVSGSGSLFKGGIEATFDTTGGGTTGLAIVAGAPGMTQPMLDISPYRLNLPLSPNWAEDLAFTDAGSASATELGWIEVSLSTGGTGYIRVYASK